MTDITRYKSDDPTAVIQNWMRNRDVIELLGLWEKLHNPDFKPLELTPSQVAYKFQMVIHDEGKWKNRVFLFGRKVPGDCVKQI